MTTETEFSWATSVSDNINVKDDKPININNEKPVINPAPAVEKYICNEDTMLVININDLPTFNYLNLKQSEILNYQLQLINQIKKNLKIMLGDEKNVTQTIIYFEKIIETSKFLAQANNQTLNYKIPYVDKNFRVLPRSSYKFCDYNYECEFNYGVKDRLCYAQHLVHNLVYLDMCVIRDYLKLFVGSLICPVEHGEIKSVNNISNININEINKSTNTISFVINHMANETKFIEFYKIDSDKIPKKKMPKKNKALKNNKNNSEKNLSHTIKSSF